MPQVRSVESFIVTLPRDTPYLGPLGPEERVNARGYLVRKGNGTLYPTVDRSVIVKVTVPGTPATAFWNSPMACGPTSNCAPPRPPNLQRRAM